MPAASLHPQRTTTTALSCHKQSQSTTTQRRPTPIPVPAPVQPSWDETSIPDYISCLHTRIVGSNQCSSAVIKTINAPISTVWSVVRRFDYPQAYKHFIKSCHLINGHGDVGTLREVHVVSGLPAESSTERLDILDDERHVLGFSMIGGDHRLNNYRSVTTLHTDGNCTVAIESYIVDIPTENTKEETCVFVDTILKCNLQSLAQTAENMAKNIISDV
ncbi:abscisic acid receptor PYL4-like [Euphorbia lathyris]|uniref:abscisic acid receptor PYL4-like n=1 Tax=Euphorbia lathyris TaxID=212925 RepID=UPI00331381AE